MTTLDTPAHTSADTTLDNADDTTEDNAENAIAALAGRLFESAVASVELLDVYLGLRLGYYAALAQRGHTVATLAAATDTHPRYVREWLEQQTVAEVLTCDDRNETPDARTFRLPPAHATVLLDADHPACTGPVALALAGVTGVLPQLLTAYRTGGGVPYADYGTDFRDGQAGFNRPAFVNLLSESWLAGGLPEVEHRLRSDTGARVADIACGAGWSSIAIARAYPHAHVDGFDIDDASIADARRNAAATDVAGRVRFEVRDAASLATSGAGTYDLVTIFEALHDMAQPVDALRACRALCSAGGSVLVMDERTADSFAESEGPVERFLYAVSTVHCLPVGLAGPGSVGTGTVMRPDTMRGYAEQAGFSDMQVLPIEHDLYRFYHLVP